MAGNRYITLSFLRNRCSKAARAAFFFMKVFEDIKNIKGIGEKTASYFNKLGVYNIDELLHYYPRTYLKYDSPCDVTPEACGRIGAFGLRIITDFKWRKVKNLNIGTGYASDGTNRVQLVFFNVPFYKSKLYRGAVYVFRGRLFHDGNTYKMEQPVFFDENEYAALQKGLWPVYRLTKGLSNKVVQRSVERCIVDDLYPELYEEYLPEEDAKEFGLCSRKDALTGIHFPDDEEHAAGCKKRLAFDELITFLMMIKQSSRDNHEKTSDYKLIETALPGRIREMLPYELTEGQKKAYEDIVSDMTGGYVMNRLVQGDVGSGKTIIAFLAMLLCADNGYQSALMAPTEILAVMHYKNLTELVKKASYDINVCLLTGQTPSKERNRIYNELKNGKINIIIGTHALFQGKVEFNDLSLVITDEQHRFGVRQRQSLSLKGKEPHILALSATPIPRTLSIVLYRDMSLSVIKSRPTDRLEIKNCVVNRNYRKKAYEFITNEVRKGHQAYVICPMIESSEGMENIENVIDYSQALRAALPSDIRIDVLHGKMKDTMKNEIMDNFATGNTDVLVSTTVIEVGIDVPNATVMMIENAERFGLAQLHQLRGRIGRGKDQSYCIFINGSDRDEENKRLEILNNSNDGFYIAEEDLKQRGAGDIFGVRQSGNIEFDIADIYDDHELIMMIGDYLDRIYSDEKIKNSLKYKKLFSYAHENMHKFIDFKTI